MTGRHAEKPSALRSGNIDLSNMHIDVPHGGLVHHQPTFSLALTTLSLHRVCVKRICRKLGGSIRAVTLQLEVRMDKFPPLESAQVTRRHKIGRFSLVLTKLFHAGAGGRHNCSISPDASLALFGFCQNFNSFTAGLRPTP